MSILNRYVLNRAYPEGSMTEGYSTKEIIECWLGYLKDKLGIGLPVPRFLGRLEGVGTVGRKIFIDKDFKGVQQAQYSILQHLTIMTPLVDEHLSMIHAESNGRSDDWIMREHKRRLTTWLKGLDLPDGETVEEQTIKRLAAGPSSQVTSWQKNSGFHIEALDERPGQRTIYYGIIDDIWEVHYGSNIQFPIFQRHWVKHPRGVELDGYGLMIVDLNNDGYKDDPWVLAS
ncbi:transposon protein, putative, CACTA, En/Spm sub-class [Panicum miliaceum]|uniref:Transposon protein, putative, CACTA, En/Spm sub-class n=1 Tax=Panicum miliaceum TaxID=4540 RepID=A0A3L6PTE4_PANMI|nr:transposon protein, putative, CACTA, En/Spm sub-class [Panicum miliaceum]